MSGDRPSDSAKAADDSNDAAVRLVDEAIEERLSPAGAQAPDRATRSDGSQSPLDIDGLFADENTKRYHDSTLEGYRERTYSKDGRLLLTDRMFYSTGVSLTFETPDGEKNVLNVTEVHSRYNAKTGIWDQIVTTGGGRNYRLERTADGTIQSFRKLTKLDEENAAGNTSARVERFRPVDGNYSPVRPPGIGELVPGQSSTGEKSGIDWRENRTRVNPDQSITYRYEGELEDSGLVDWGDTNFSGWETVDRDGQIVDSGITYETPVDIRFAGPRGWLEVKAVTSVETKRDRDGNYVTDITEESGRVWHFASDSSGRALSMQEPA